MELEQLRRIIKKSETMKVEFKTTPLLKPTKENRFKIAAQLVAFANRNGGYLIFGVKDDGTFQGAEINEDKEVQKISYIAKDRCSPQVVFTHQFLQTKEGDVLVIEIQRRKGIPHAVVERDNHEIKRRIYYVRNPKGNSLVDDKTLEFLFKNIEAPKISSRFPFYVTYRRKKIHLPLIESPTSSLQFVYFFSPLTEEDKSYLSEGDLNKVRSFVVEIAPFAVLKYLGQFFPYSWQMEIFRTKAGIKMQPKKETIKGRTVSFADLDVPSDSLIAKLSFDFKEILKSIPDRIVIPPDAEVKINLADSGKSRFKSSLTIVKEEAFLFEIEFLGARSYVGLPFGSPLRYKYQRIDISTDIRKKVQEMLATVRLDINFNADFRFPDVNDPFFAEHFEYGKTILDLLEHDWNWDRFLKDLPHGKLYAIEDKIDEILRRLRKQDS